MNGYNYTQMGWYHAKGDPAARLRQRKYALLRRLQIPRTLCPARSPLRTAAAESPTAGVPRERDIRVGR